MFEWKVLVRTSGTIVLHSRSASKAKVSHFVFPGWSKQVDYEPGTGSKQLFPMMHLETCGGPMSSVQVMVELQTSHIGKGCDRETYSEKLLQKLCGES